MKKVLILEDKHTHHNKISSLLNQIEDIEVLPKFVPDEDIQDWNDLIDLAKNQKFEDIDNRYKNMDLYIIDVCILPNETDQTGLDFIEFLLQEYGNEIYNKTIVVTNNNKSDLNYSLPDTVPFISKMFRRKDYSSKILVESLKKLGIKTSITYKSDNHSIEHVEIFYDDLNESLDTNKEVDSKQIEATELREVPRKSKDSKPKIHRSSIIKPKDEDNGFLDKLLRKIIDPLILFSFYFLILLTTVYGVYKSSYEVIKSFKGSEKKIELVDGVETIIESDVDTYILLICEHIFLYFLPVFILFGFIVYYKGDLRTRLLDGNYNLIDHDLSVKSIYVTKTLFISSILSYVIIKFIEEVFFEEVDVSTLLASGSLILILIVYLIFSGKSH